MSGARAIVWSALAAALAVGGFAYPRFWAQQARPSGARETAPSSAPEAPELRRLVELGRRHDPVAAEELARVYAEAGTDPETLRARALALGALLSEPNLALRLKRVLDAVAASKTPPERDSLWPRAVESLAGFWRGADFDRGRDLMLSEARGVPRRLLIESFVELGRSSGAHELDAAQRLRLLADLIDLYFSGVDPSLKPGIVESVRMLGGDELASVLAGADLGKGSQHPAIAQYKRRLGEAERAMVAPLGSAR